MTADIQDFKSSFKQTISGGLRAATQIIGCSVTLFLISPYMTVVSLLCIPSVIGVGTLFGSLLRLTSRKAQAQVSLFRSVQLVNIKHFLSISLIGLQSKSNRKVS